jgi:hypothetical protein
VLLPWFFKCLGDGSINLNRLALNFATTITEIITRNPQYQAPQPEQPAQKPAKRNNGL